MAVCKFCGVPFSWGRKEDDGWIALVPVGEEGELSRDYVDSEGELRASHRQICVNKGGPSVRVTKLAKPVKAKDMIRQPTSGVSTTPPWKDEEHA